MNDNYEPTYVPETEVVYLIDLDGFYVGRYDLIIRDRLEYGGRFVRDAPPLTGDNEIAKINDLGEWEIIPDYRGQVLYDSKLKSMVRINYLGDLRSEHSGDFPDKLETLPTVVEVY